MSVWPEPQRLTQQGDDESELAAAIRELRASEASPAEIAALERRLELELAEPAVVTPALPSARSSVSGAWLATIILVATAAMYGSVRLFGGGEPQPRAATVALRDSPAQTPAATEHAETPLAAAPIVGGDQPGVAELAAAPIVDGDQPPVAARVETPRPRAPALSPRKWATPAVVAEEASPQPANPEAELVLLQRAQAALEGQPAAALALTEQHARAYPRGIFVQEREMLAIEALLALERRPAAIARAKEFLARYPTSPHARRVRPLIESYGATTTLPSTDHP